MTLGLTKTPRFWNTTLRRNAGLLGALALGASFACSSSEQPVPGSGSGGSPASTGGAPTAGSPPIVAGGPAGGSAALGGAANVGGTVGASGNSSASAGSGGSASSSAGNAGGGGRPGAGGSAAGGSAAGGSAAGGSAAGGSAGSSSAGAGTGGGGSGTFAPCPTTGACKILPFGDSITYGLLYPDYTALEKLGGYRVQIFTNAVAANQNITFTGSQSTGPAMVAGKPFPKMNEGHSGWTIDPGGTSPGGISTLVPSPGFTTIPNIVLLMIGTNDAGQSLSAQQMADNLAKLIDKVISTAPDALLVVASIPPLSSQTAKVNSYNALIPPLVMTRANAGKHILFVDHKLTAADMTGDNVHPNAGGYTKMGNSWYEVIKSYLRTGT